MRINNRKLSSMWLPSLINTFVFCVFAGFSILCFSKIVGTLIIMGLVTLFLFLQIGLCVSRWPEKFHQVLRCRAFSKKLSKIFVSVLLFPRHLILLVRVLINSFVYCKTLVASFQVGYFHFAFLNTEFCLLVHLLYQ